MQVTQALRRGVVRTLGYVETPGETLQIILEASAGSVLRMVEDGKFGAECAVRPATFLRRPSCSGHPSCSDQHLLSSDRHRRLGQSTCSGAPYVAAYGAAMHLLHACCSVLCQQLLISACTEKVVCSASQRLASTFELFRHWLVNDGQPISTNLKRKACRSASRNV